MEIFLECVWVHVLSQSVVSNSLGNHELQHARLPCSSLSPGVCSNLCPLSQWCHPAISSSVTPFSSCPQSFPSSGSFTMSWHFASGGQSIGASVSVSGLPMNIQDWFSLNRQFYLLTIQETLRSLLQHHGCKDSILQHSTFFMVQFSHSNMTTGKTIALTIWTFVHKTMYLLFLYAVKVDTVFLSRSKSF